MITLSEYEARALTNQLREFNEKNVLQWLPDYLDRLERDIAEYQSLIERGEQLHASMSNLFDALEGKT